MGGIWIAVLHIGEGYGGYLWFSLILIQNCISNVFKGLNPATARHGRQILGDTAAAGNYARVMERVVRQAGDDSHVFARVIFDEIVEVLIEVSFN